jgi:hypothetical protein
MAATDWIKVRVNLWSDPRVIALCDKTDEGKAAVVGGLYWLWASADAHSADGYMPGLTVKSIDRETGIKGIGQALVDIGWLNETPGGIHIARFNEHNGTSAKKRAVDAKRQSNNRGGTADSSDQHPDFFAGSSSGCHDGGVTDDGQGADKKRETSELDKDKSKKKSKPKPSSSSTQKVSAEQKELEAMGVEPQHAADWLKARKAKNLVATTTAFEQAASEAAKLGWTFPEAIAYAAGKGWGGFMAKWVENDGDTGHYGVRNGAVTASAPAGNTKGPKNKAQVQGEQLDAAAAEFAANMAAKYGPVDGPASQDPAAYVPPNDGMTFDME